MNNNPNVNEMNKNAEHILIDFICRKSLWWKNVYFIGRGEKIGSKIHL